MAQERLRPVKIRLPESLRRELRRLAFENRRSMNTEIITRLERSLESEAHMARDARRRTEMINRLEDMEGRLLRGFDKLGDQVRKALKERGKS